METLRKILEQAETNGVAIGHFNISDLVTLKAVFEAARDLNVPVIVGASEGERQFMGVRQVSALVKSLREEYDFPIFLNADHTHSPAQCHRSGESWIRLDRVRCFDTALRGKHPSNESGRRKVKGDAS